MTNVEMTNAHAQVLVSFLNQLHIISLDIHYMQCNLLYIIESVDSISRDEPDSPLTQYITNAGISRARYTITLFKHHHRVLRLISNRISV